MEIIFATHNDHKLEEVNAMLVNSTLSIIGLTELGFHEEIEETGSTFEENAFIKAKALFDKFNKPVFSEDSGLVIDALNGDPGVYSARYAGEEKNHDLNIEKALKNLTGTTNRQARFKSCICFIDKSGPQYFIGTCEGTISHERQGTGGFGYDPIFVPEGYSNSFAVLTNDIKNQISHRRQSLDLFCDWLLKNKH